MGLHGDNGSVRIPEGKIMSDEKIQVIRLAYGKRGWSLVNTMRYEAGVKLGNGAYLTLVHISRDYPEVAKALDENRVDPLLLMCKLEGYKIDEVGEKAGEKIRSKLTVAKILGIAKYYEIK